MRKLKVPGKAGPHPACRPRPVPVKAGAKNLARKTQALKLRQVCHSSSSPYHLPGLTYSEVGSSAPSEVCTSEGKLKSQMQMARLRI